MRKTNIYCDRCKRNVSDLSFSKMEESKDYYSMECLLPVFKIKEHVDFSGCECEIDLCCECSKKLHEWIWGYKKEEGE